LYSNACQFQTQQLIKPCYAERDNLMHCLPVKLL
jgi:hypothetical protein